MVHGGLKQGFLAFARDNKQLLENFLRPWVIPVFKSRFKVLEGRWMYGTFIQGRIYQIATIDSRDSKERGCGSPVSALRLVTAR
jgi:hypothetical protein